MRIHLIAVGKQMPAWVEAGYQEYTKRFPSDCKLVLHEIPAMKRNKSSDLARILRLESEQMLTQIDSQQHVVALDLGGSQYDTSGLAQRINQWKNLGKDLALLIGGPEGLSEACLQRADERWSLARLTFPHPLVRVIVAEQLYRGLTILQGHPYHR